MANPRRNSFPITDESINSNPEINNPFRSQTLTSKLSKLKFFLKKPHAFPFLLSIFLFLTWVFLRFQHPLKSQPTINNDPDPDPDRDRDANLFRFRAPVSRDSRGWLLDPVSIALDSGVRGGASVCASVHVGEIRRGSLRGNHRHHTCNETFLIWGARTLFRVEKKGARKGYGEVRIGADEVAIAVSPSGTAHALVNLDAKRSTFFVACQDRVINYNDSTSDFNVWKDLSF